MNTVTFKHRTGSDTQSHTYHLLSGGISVKSKKREDRIRSTISYYTISTILTIY